MKHKIVLSFGLIMFILTFAYSGEDTNIYSDITKENDSVIDTTTITEPNEGTDTIESFDSTVTTQQLDATGKEINTIKLKLEIGDMTLTATLVNNSSTEALISALSEAPITVKMRDYGNMEKVGSLGREFPRNDEQISTEAGDIILYQGRSLVIYYSPNSWSYTRLGKIDNISAQELKEILGDGDITVTLSLPGD